MTALVKKSAWLWVFFEGLQVGSGTAEDQPSFMEDLGA